MGLDPIEQAKRRAIAEGLRKLSQANADMLLYLVERQREAITASIRDDIDAHLAAAVEGQRLDELHVSDVVYEVLYGKPSSQRHYLNTLHHAFLVHRDPDVVGWELRESTEAFATDTPLSMAAQETYNEAHRERAGG